MNHNVNITGDDLKDVLEISEKLGCMMLNKYVEIRHLFNQDHERSKRLAFAKLDRIEHFKLAIELGVTFDQIDTLMENDYLIANITYVMQETGATLQEAIDAHQARTLTGGLRDYVRVHNNGKTHAEILAVANTVRTTSANLHDVILLVFDENIPLSDAIEVSILCRTRYVIIDDYLWSVAGSSSHREAINWFTANYGLIGSRIP